MRLFLNRNGQTESEGLIQETFTSGEDSDKFTLVLGPLCQQGTFGDREASGLDSSTHPTE